MEDLRSLVAAAEDRSGLPPGQEERFAGYGVMGLPFRSGHLPGAAELHRERPAPDGHRVRLSALLGAPGPVAALGSVAGLRPAGPPG
ncbi:hypothetical protein [Kocuria arenosa]|uniref:hypothetical protein n=1 Tax=Kocuria arenosa TaxID=3071446 RepID=UPI0034D51A0F